MELDSPEYLAAQQLVQRTLRQHAFDNRGSLPLAALNQLGAVLARSLLGAADTCEQDATSLANRGLALVSVTSAGLAVKSFFTDRNELEIAAQVSERLSRLMLAINSAAMQSFQIEQERIRLALEHARQQSH